MVHAQPLLGVLLALSANAGQAEIREVAGVEGDFAHVLHVRIEGSSFEIGRELARFGSEEHGFQPDAAHDATAVRAQREWFAAHDPAHVERMRGVAAFFGLEDRMDAFELAGIPYGFARGGCTVVFYPPETTESGKGVLARNFDFTTGTFDGRVPGPEEMPVASSPVLLELHPTDAYASIAVVAFDLLGVVDGINSEGLTVALLADDELFAKGLARPVQGVRAGLGVLQVGRHLLDTCKDVEEAKVALRGASFYYTSIPCHYVVADRHGHAFIWENAVDLSGGHVIEEDGPLVSTNYLRHLYPDPEKVPEDHDPLGLYGRERTVRACFTGQGKFSTEEIRANAERVSPRAIVPTGRAAGRTLWYAQYVPEERRVDVDFYLGETPKPGGGREIRRSPVVELSLAAAPR
jgi:hypothetical protein